MLFWAAKNTALWLLLRRSRSNFLAKIFIDYNIMAKEKEEIREGKQIHFSVGALIEKDGKYFWFEKLKIIS